MLGFFEVNSSYWNVVTALLSSTVFLYSEGGMMRVCVTVKPCMAFL
jgi:hypothetical protein